MDSSTLKIKTHRLMDQGKLNVAAGARPEFKRRGLLSHGGRAQKKQTVDAGRSAFIQALLKR